MNKGSNKYGILLLGCALVFGSYFIARTIQFLSRETAAGTVTAISWRNFLVGNARTRGDYHGEYQCPEIHFLYKHSAADTGIMYSVRPESLSNKEYKPGEKTGVIFPKGQPELARIYSLREFWFTTPYMIILTAIAALWSIGFLVVVFKPWLQMDE